MLGVTLFGIFLTPVFYCVIEWFGDAWRGAFVSSMVGWLPRIAARVGVRPRARDRGGRPSVAPPPDFDSTCTAQSRKLLGIRRGAA